jgi:hypothetical protein
MGMKLPVESKVTYPAGVGLVVTAVYAAASRYHWFTPPPPDVTVPVLTAVWAVTGWLAPHTSRALPPQERADFAEWTAAGKPRISLEQRRRVPPYVPGGIVQAGGTGTGPAKEGTP